MALSSNNSANGIDKFSSIIHQGGDSAVKAMNIFMKRTSDAMKGGASAPSPKLAQPAPAAPQPKPAAPVVGGGQPAINSAGQKVKTNTNRPVGMNASTGKFNAGQLADQAGVGETGGGAGGDSIHAMVKPSEKIVQANQQVGPPGSAPQPDARVAEKGAIPLPANIVQAVGAAPIHEFISLMGQAIKGDGPIPGDVLAKVNRQLSADMEKQAAMKAGSQDPTRGENIAGNSAATGGKTPPLGGPSASPAGVATPRPAPPSNMGKAPALPARTGGAQYASLLNPKPGLA